IEVVLPAIGGRGEDVVNTAGREAPSSAQDASLIEVGSNRFDLHGAAGGSGCQIKHETNDSGFGVLDCEDLLVFVSPPLLHLHPVPEWGARAVPEALPGILQHCAMHMLRILAGLVLVEDVEQLAEHFPARVMRHLLGDRDELDTDLAQLANVEFRMEGVAAE